MEAPNTIELFLNPEKYGYKECSHCRGYGSSLKEDAPKCTKCGGMGLVKKEDV
jgi:DnaJ-class molecular chaperone